MNKYKNVENNIVKPLAIVMAIIFIITFIVNVIPINAVTSNGFVNSSEISPPNRILFNNADTGIKSNPDGIKIFACCGKDTRYSGAIFATIDGNYQNVVVQNLSWYSSYSEEMATVVYNGTTIYINHNYLISGTAGGNNYSYATFDNSWNPTNEIANNFYQYVIDNSIETNTGNEINYSLPAGNVAIIETNSNYSFINLKTTMPLQSTSFANNPWPNTTQRIGFYGTLPLTLNPNTMGNVIEWERNGNTTLFNITTSAKYDPSVVSTFKYVVIANPFYYPANDMEDSQYTNGDINISMDGVVNITVKSLTATVNTQTGTVEDNYNGTEWTGEVDETTNDIIWTDGNGNNNVPTSGGNLSDPSISGFQSWLKGILNNIVNIFQPAHDAINTLSGAVSNFASWMYALYVWLPSPILSLLTSAISLAIVIGIIKVFI